MTGKTRRQKEIADGMLPGDVINNAKELFRTLASGNNWRSPLRILCASVVPYIELSADFSKLNQDLIGAREEIERAMKVKNIGKQEEELCGDSLPDIRFGFDIEQKDVAHIKIGDRIYGFRLDIIQEPYIIKTIAVFVFLGEKLLFEYEGGNTKRGK